MIDNLAVLVGTCDRYSPLWSNFIKCYEKYFPYGINTVFVGETLSVPEYITHTPGHGTWGQRIRDSLVLIPEDNILFLLDDYFVSFDYGRNRLEKYVKDMDRYSMNRLQISRSNFQIYSSSDDYYLKLHNASDYSFSLQPSIWKKSWIYQNCSDTFTPWDFEILNSNKYSNRDTSTYVDPSINFPVYFNAVRRGFIKSEGWEDFSFTEGLQEF